MKEKQFLKVSLNEINLEDHFYSFCYPDNAINKLQEYKGDLFYQPILLEKHSSFYRVIEGFDRINYLSSRENHCIEAFILTDELPLSLFIKGILYVQTYRNLNLIEKAIILEKLTSTFKVSKNEIIHSFLPMIKEKPSFNLFKSILQLNQLSTIAKNYVVEGNLSLNLAKEFSQFSFEEQDLIFQWIHRLRLGINKVRFLLETLKYLSKRDHKGIVELLRQNLFSDLLYSDIKSISTFQKRFIEILHIMRFPKYQSQIKKINFVIKSFKLPPRWNILPPKNLEGEGIEIIFHIRNQEEYSIAVKKLEDIFKNRAVEKLFNLL